jgi:UDP-N-acetylglucosamine 1-carboxyvinyltransferase
MIPDEIEAGTYLAACAATGGRVTVIGISPHALRPLTDHLKDMGCEIDEGVFSITCKRTGNLFGTRVRTGPHPAFPTDLHPPLVAAMCVASTPSLLTETIWQDRFQYTKELEKLGARFSIQGDTIEVSPSVLTAGDMTATDLRGGAAALIAALCAKGVSRIAFAERLVRGYEALAMKLSSLGASIRLYP